MKFGGNEAFISSKQATVSTPALGLPNFVENFVLETDALDRRHWGSFGQHGRPLTDMSKAFGLGRKGWIVYSKEMLAVIEAIRMWQFLLTIQTQNNQMTSIMIILKTSPKVK